MHRRFQSMETTGSLVGHFRESPSFLLSASARTRQCGCWALRTRSAASRIHAQARESFSIFTDLVVGSVSGDTSHFDLDVLELAGLAAVSLVFVEVAHYLGRHGHTADGKAKSSASFSTTCSSNGKFAPELPASCQPVGVFSVVRQLPRPLPFGRRNTYASCWPGKPVRVRTLETKLGVSWRRLATTSRKNMIRPSLARPQQCVHDSRK